MVVPSLFTAAVAELAALVVSGNIHGARTIHFKNPRISV